ncbi:MAG: cysteine desulfurase [Synergistaceae bacterium]|jgi:cysteine desulfurase|nr:cysteine desulfurase [Synergistaceae bacterium]
MKVYADHAATTPLAPEVLEAMRPFLEENYYNPSALYAEARAVRSAIGAARASLSEILEADGGKIIFTGSGTESDNLAIHSAVCAAGERRRVLISSAEHHAVLNSVDALARFGFTAERLPVNRFGHVSPDILKSLIGPDVCLVSVMTVNNETGAINDVVSLCRIAHDAGALFHTDAVQALGVLRLGAATAGFDYLSVSAHKIYGPKGVGALYSSPDVPISPLIRGGGQESGLRAGTENTAGIIGFGAAAKLARERLERDTARLRDIKRVFLKETEAIPHIMVNSPPDGAPHIISLSVEGIEGEACLLRMAMAGVQMSMGAACDSASVEPSHVVTAIGVPSEYRRGTMRFSFGRETTEEEAVYAGRTFAEVVAKLR